MSGTDINPQGLATSPDLLAAIERARTHVMSPAEQHAQRRSFVIGQVHAGFPDLPYFQLEALVDRVLGPAPEEPASTAGAGAGDWVTVPREPTHDMLVAGYTAYAEAEWDAGRAKRGPERDSLPIAFRAMLAKAPAVPASPRAGAGEGENREFSTFLDQLTEEEEKTVADLMAKTPSFVAAWFYPNSRNCVDPIRRTYRDNPPPRKQLILCELLRQVVQHHAKASPPAPAEHGVEIRDLVGRARLQAASERAIYGDDAGELYDELADAIVSALSQADAGRSERAVEIRELSEKATTGAPCHWGGGNDIIWCSTCGAQYAYAKGEERPPCPRSAAPAQSPSTSDREG